MPIQFDGERNYFPSPSSDSLQSTSSLLHIIFIIYIHTSHIIYNLFFSFFIVLYHATTFQTLYTISHYYLTLLSHDSQLYITI
jgi:hypothetical protein